ncbi:MAG: DNA topoisomerase III [Magnetococcales bacterium]|nr:DNA topoisomerase III [Magnetococcales bacterium]
MMLFLCEKPSQARDIGRILGATQRREGYLQGPDKQVTWCIGHLLEMSAPDGYKTEWKPWRLDTLPLIPDQWKLEVRQSVGKQFKVIQSLLKGVDQVILATDADREGETIGREVLERCQYQGKILRLWLSALDDASIRKALDNLLPGEKTRPLYQAGMGRARADWLVGMNLSRAYTILGRQGGYDGVLTVGRVQTPTLKLVVDRDRQIERFVAVDFFDVLALIKPASAEKPRYFVAKWIPAKKFTDEAGRCLDEKKAWEVVEKITEKTALITKAETKRLKDPPPLPLELSTLQQEGSKRWGMGAKQVLEVAQSLYEKHKAITYPRSDCRHLPKSQIADIQSILSALKQSDPSLTPLIESADPKCRSKVWDDKKITAHHAIIPTAAAVKVQTMSADEFRLYDLVRRYYLVQFYPAFEYDRTQIDCRVEKELFRATGRVEMVPGWKQVLGRENSESASHSKEKQRSEQNLPLVQKGEEVWIEKAKIEAKKTKPLPRFTEGTLIQAMKNIGRLIEDERLRKILRETAGIGTEATRASIIENLLMRKLLARSGKKNLISQPAGRALIDMLPHSVTDPATTAVWEQALDDISQGQGTLDGFLEKSKIWISRLVRNVQERERLGIRQFSNFQDDANIVSERDGPLIKCPRCGRVMRRRNGSQGTFFGCSGYPNCRGTLPDSTAEAQTTPVSEVVKLPTENQETSENPTP